MELIRQFNKYAQDNQSLIQKALTTATGVGAALIPENLEKLITDTLIRLSPELAMALMKKISGKTHEFNRLIQRPSRGGAMGENATTPITNSKTVRDSVELKIIRRKGKVTNFMIDTSEEYIDAAAYEMENHIQAHVLDLIYYLIWGNANANAYEFSGLEQFIASRHVAFSAAEGGAVPTTLAFLDDMIDWSNRRGGARHTRTFLMSPEMLSKVSSLLTNVRLNQGLIGNGLTQVEIGGGWRLNAYRDIPIIETTSLSPVETMTPTVTAVEAATGGSLSDDTYYVYVAPVTVEGEQLPCTEKTVILNEGTAVQAIKIDFSAPHYSSDYEGNQYASAYAYKIYVGIATGSVNCPLVKMVSAFTYDSEGAPNGDNGVDASIYVTTLTPGDDVPTHLQADTPLITSTTNPQSIILWDTDPIQGLGKLPFTNKPGDRFEGMVVTKPLAETDDFINFLIKSYTALTDSYEATSYWLRNIRPA